MGERAREKLFFAVTSDKLYWKNKKLRRKTTMSARGGEQDLKKRKKKKEKTDRLFDVFVNHCARNLICKTLAVLYINNMVTNLKIFQNGLSYS
jgi:hypothetical protein